MCVHVRLYLCYSCLSAHREQSTLTKGNSTYFSSYAKTETVLSKDFCFELQNRLFCNRLLETQV